MRQRGRSPSQAVNSSCAARASWSWPSTSFTCQPKARHLSAKGSMFKGVGHRVRLCSLLLSTTAKILPGGDGGEEDGLPVGALVALAVAHQGVDPVASPRLLAGKGHARAHRQAVARERWTAPPGHPQMAGAGRRACCRCRSGWPTSQGEEAALGQGGVHPGPAWPLLRMKRSRSGQDGSWGRTRSTRP